MGQEIHTPVLARESADFLITGTAGNYFDGTVGFGGHSSLFLSRLSAAATLCATDVDLVAFEHCRGLFAADSRVRLYNFNFAKIDDVCRIEGIAGFNGIFADLGVSSYQLDSPGAGFSFRQDAPLDLRMDKSKPLTAADIINSFSEDELSSLFYTYGEEYNSRKIASAVVAARAAKTLQNSSDLAAVIRKITPVPYVAKTLTRVFQALRIYINNELEVLKEFLSKAVDVLLPGGRIVVLTYHSLEDRIVKEAFRYEERTCVCPPGFPVCTCGKVQRLTLLTRKPVAPSAEEVAANFRARSARLRVAERV